MQSTDIKPGDVLRYLCVTNKAKDTLERYLNWYDSLSPAMKEIYSEEYYAFLLALQQKIQEKRNESTVI